MTLFFSNKVVRLLLSVSVSIWMAGGCLFGCTNMTMAAETDDSVLTVEAGESCQAPRSGHDCCASQKPKKQTARTIRLEGVASFAPAPSGSMNDCPLVTNATAATSKNSSHAPDPGRTPVAALPQLERQNQTPDTARVVPPLPSRGSTHLLCCVFLI